MIPNTCYVICFSPHLFSSNHLYTLVLWLFNLRWVGVGIFFIYCAGHTLDLFKLEASTLNFRNIVFSWYFLYFLLLEFLIVYYISWIYLVNLSFLLYTTVSFAIFSAGFSWSYLLALLLLIVFFLSLYFFFTLELLIVLWLYFFTASHYFLDAIFSLTWRKHSDYYYDVINFLKFYFILYIVPVASGFLSSVWLFNLSFK